MERLLTFLYAASISFTLFFMLYWIFLRELTHFKVNRFFLLTSLLASVFIAAFPIHYEPVIPLSETLELRPLIRGIENGKTIPTAENSLSWSAVQIFIYGVGVLVFVLRLIIQTAKILLVIYRSEAKKVDNCYLHENKSYTLPFSFFNHIFINPDIHKQVGLDDILAHEKVHIREHHWIDLLFIELLTVFFWFNPFIWFFEHAIKQNHEFLADEGVLSLGHSTVRYQALLVNQLMGIQVIGLTNHLTFALGPNRLNMMTKQKTPKRKLLRIAWAVPVLAMLLTAFAKPEYQSNTPNGSQIAAFSATKEKDSGKTRISGKVVSESGDPLSGAAVIIRGTTTGTVADENGNFSLEVPASGTSEIVISYVGFRSIVQKISPGKDGEWNFKMKREVIGIDTKSVSPGGETTTDAGSAVNVQPVPDVKTAKETSVEIEKTAGIKSDADKEIPFIEKEIPSPPPPPAGIQTPEEIFTIVEEMPEYPGGHGALMKYIREKRSELKAASQNKLKGKAMAGFTIDEKGKATNIRIVNKTTDEAAKALTSIVEGMSTWSPGKQQGKAVPVDYELQLKF